MVGNVPPFVPLCVDYNIFGDVEWLVANQFKKVSGTSDDNSEIVLLLPNTEGPEEISSLRKQR